jgi:hypothetical protein
MSIDLVAKGVQDAYLTGNPEVSFFRQQYKRHTNFAQRSVKIIPQGTLAPGQTVSLKIPNKGDLLGYIWMDLGNGTVCDRATSNTESYQNPDSPINSCGIWADSDSNTAIFELYIGGQLIDRQDSVYLVQYWNKFLLDKSSAAPAASNAGNIYTSTWLPLHFFFCDSVYLPLVSLQYHEVEVRITFSGATGSALSPATTATNMANINFYANYVLLDTEERKALVDKEQDYLIEQVQKITFNSNRCDLSFLNHPVKCLMWGHGNPAHTPNPSSNTVQLYLNGTEMFNVPMPYKMFNQIQAYYHSEIASYRMADPSDLIQMYSFALKANKHQPCGSCNFSRLDNGSLQLDSGAPTYLYAVNYNILRIRSGLGGLAFSN